MTDLCPMEAGAKSAASRKRPADSRPIGADLYRQLMAEGERRGMNQSRVSTEAFGHGSQMTVLRKGTHPVTNKVYIRAVAWLRREPVDQVAARMAKPARVTGPALAAEIDRFLAKTGWSPTRFSKTVFNNNPSALIRMRSSGLLQDVTVARVRAFIAQFGQDQDDGAPVIDAPVIEPRPDRLPASPNLVIGDPRSPRTWSSVPPRSALAKRIAAIGAQVDAEQRAETINARTPTLQQGLRQVVDAWPDQWARIRSLAASLDVLPGEAFARVVDAGLNHLEEGDA